MILFQWKNFSKMSYQFATAAGYKNKDQFCYANRGSIPQSLNFTMELPNV